MTPRTWLENYEVRLVDRAQVVARGWARGAIREYAWRQYLEMLEHCLDKGFLNG